MKDALSDRPWNEFMPETFAWLDRLKVVTAPPPEGVHRIIAVTYVKGATPDFEFDAPDLDSKRKADLTQQAKLLGWTTALGTTSLISGGSTYVLVPKSSLKVGNARIARQIGLDAAAHLRNKTNVEQFAFFDGAQLSSVLMFEGLAQGYYKLLGFKKKDPTVPAAILPNTVYFVSKVEKSEIEKTRIGAKAQALSRMVSDAPPNWLNPEKFSQIARDLAAKHKFKCSVYGREEILKLGMGSFYSVGKGSPFEPQLIVLEIEGQDTSRTVSLVGKGLTFDSGGTSLKPSTGMGEMKYDMCGGAIVLASAYFLSQVKPPTNVVCIIGAVENIIGSWASRPSDIVTAMNGKTIEILNTDAEGRLVLADLLHYAASRYKPEFIIDVATLTGAVQIALGAVGSAVLANNDAVANFVLKVAQEHGEPLWQLPMWPELTKEVNSSVADLKNIANADVKAGTLIGGIFLREFVGDTPWVHVDIAGTAWNCKAVGYPNDGGGASAFGFRTLINSCLEWER